MKILNLFILIIFSLNSFSEIDLICSGFNGVSLNRQVSMVEMDMQERQFSIVFQKNMILQRIGQG